MIGTTLSHYRITGKLGAGGRGIVYRAEDTNLNRQVAIKVLPEMFSGEPERMARFEREAKPETVLLRNRGRGWILATLAGEPILVAVHIRGGVPHTRGVPKISYPECLF